MKTDDIEPIFGWGERPAKSAREICEKLEASSIDWRRYKIDFNEISQKLEQDLTAAYGEFLINLKMEQLLHSTVTIDDIRSTRDAICDAVSALEEMPAPLRKFINLDRLGRNEFEQADSVLEFLKSIVEKLEPVELSKNKFKLKALGAPLILGPGRSRNTHVIVLAHTLKDLIENHLKVRISKSATNRGEAHCFFERQKRDMFILQEMEILYLLFNQWLKECTRKNLATALNAPQDL